MGASNIYCIYLYCDRYYNTSGCDRGGNSYGYWSGESYTVQGEEFPVCEPSTNKRKWYKNLKRAISGGEITFFKYSYVCGFDIEDEIGNIVYESNRSISNNSVNQIVRDESSNNIETSKEDNARKRVIQVAVVYVESIPNDMTDIEIDEYLKDKYPDKVLQWCDSDKDIFDYS